MTEPKYVQIDQRFLKLIVKRLKDTLDKTRKSNDYPAALGAAEGCMQAVLPFLEGPLIKSND